MTKHHEIDRDELRLMAGLSVQRWAHELSRRLSPDDAWRLLLGGCIAVLQKSHTSEEIARVLREAADLLERGELKRGKKH
jgi:hypothetical protein